MNIVKRGFIFVVIFIMTISLSMISNFSLATSISKLDKIVEEAQNNDEEPELKPGHNLKLDKSPTISFKKKNSEKLAITMQDGTGFESIRYQYPDGNKDSKLSAVSRKKLKET